MFDPYHRWLAIPKDQRPPTLYQLLGIAPDENDAEVINEAALRQMSHVRTYQSGPNAEVCSKILNEIAQARATLLNREKRRDYDSQHSVSLSPPPLPTVEVDVEPVILPERVPAALDGRSALLVLIGAGSMLVAQLLAWGIFRLVLSLLGDQTSPIKE